MAKIVSDQQMASIAQQLAVLPASQNPAVTPGAINQFPPDAQGPIVQTITHPVHGATARGGAAGGPQAMSQSNTVVPQHANRNPLERHQLLGFVSSLVGSGATGSIVATPYAPFRGRRIVLSPFTINAGSPGYVNTIQVGIRPQFAALNNEPLEMFAAGLQAGYCELDQASPAIGISMNVTLTASATVYGCLVGITTRNKAANRPQGANRKLLRLPMNISTGIGVGASSNITITPTLKFWPRKVTLGEADCLAGPLLGTTHIAATGAAGMNTTGIFVGPSPQLANLPTATAPVPSAVFNLNYNLWLDFDMADTAVPLTFQQTVIGTVSCFFSGVIEGDANYSDLATS